MLLCPEISDDTTLRLSNIPNRAQTICGVRSLRPRNAIGNDALAQRDTSPVHSEAAIGAGRDIPPAPARWTLRPTTIIIFIFVISMIAVVLGVSGIDVVVLEN
uniref:Uncharacterized protein n=1 Tax=Anopheles farauti TaxID=69004 RepID=A0A182Q1R6_9DIPT